MENDSWQVVIHEFPAKLLPTFREIFPDIKAHLTANLAPPTQGLSLITLWQRTTNDMSGYSEPVEEERAEKTAKFIDWANKFSTAVKSTHPGAWIDFVDPSSGLPFLGCRGSTVFVETDDAVFHLGYTILDFGCCKAVSHALWRTNCFLSLLITDLPLESIQATLKTTPGM